MRYIILTLLPFLSIFLQCTIFHSYSIKGTVPDLVLVFVSYYAMLNPARNSAIYGFICGLLEDLYMGRMIGINAVAKSLTAFILAKFQGNVFQENILVGVIGVIMASLLNAIVLFLLSLSAFSLYHFDQQILLKVVYQTVYNTVLAAPIYVLYYRSSFYGWLKENR